MTDWHAKGKETKKALVHQFGCTAKKVAVVQIELHFRGGYALRAARTFLFRVFLRVCSVYSVVILQAGTTEYTDFSTNTRTKNPPFFKVRPKKGRAKCPASTISLSRVLTKAFLIDD